jgi:cytochrome c peroxidase
MSLVNLAFSATLTWRDPELRSLEAQALIPMLSEHPVELGLRGHEAPFLHVLRSDAVYREMFPKAFPGEGDPFTLANVTKALATFERTIVSSRTPYDRYHSGGEDSAISGSAKRGETAFFSDQIAGCFRCHGGFNFSDGLMHNTALARDQTAKFKTPTLRNVALTAPYMHDGSIATLEAVLDHYSAGGRAHDNPRKDARMKGFQMTPQNRLDLIEFLRTLTDSELIHDSRFSNPW